MLKRLAFVFLFVVPSVGSAQTAGQVMFVGFNADGNDGFSFVTLVDLANGTNIRFNDNEWNGSPIGGGGAFNAGEGSMTWNNNTGNVIFAGTVITVTNSATTPATTVGTISAGTIALDPGNEVLYMFIGTDASTPTTFLSAIANDTFANGSITNTGLTAGTNAISITGDEDVMVYTGSINCTSTIANCTTAIATATSWTTQDTGADDSVNGFPDFPADVPCNFFGAAFGVVTYYSRNATSGGAWDSNTSWTTNSDGTGGPLAAGVWPRRHDRVVILSGHTITVNATNDNKSCGVAPDDLPYSNVGAFTSSNIDMFYHTGDISISGTLTVTGIEMMIEGFTRVLAGGTFTLGSTLVNVGYLQADATSTFTMLDDLALTGNSVTIINTTSTSADDLLIDFTDATLCGTGVTNLLNGAGSQITYTNGASVNQICSTFTITCTGPGCSGFPVAGSGTPTTGNTGPGGVGVSQNNRIWLRADRGTFTDAGTTPATNLSAVRQWNDQSGNGNNALQNTLANRPIFRTGQDNGLPALEFTGDLFIDPPSLGISGAGGFSYFVVFRDTQTGLGALTDGSGHFILDRTTATNPLVSLKPITGSFYGFQKRTDGGGGLGGVLSSTSINTNMKWIEMERRRGVTYGLFYNGLLQNTIADTDGDLTPPIPRIGRHATTANGGLRGFLHEFFVYSSTINNAQRIIINNYVAAKYGLVIAANDLYTMDDPGNGNFDFEVAGVGQAADNSNHLNARGSGIVGIRVQSPTSLTSNEFLLWGHNNGLLVGSVVDVDGTIIQERLSRIWRASETGDVGPVAVSFDVSGLGGSPLGSNLRLLIDRDGDGFADNDVTPIGGGTFSGNIVTFIDVNLQNGDRFTLGNTNLSNPLPIELISFTARPRESEIQLDWSTASELNNDFFTIERSRDAEQWEEVRTIQGAGTKSGRTDYQTTDDFPYPGVSYYRLKQTDFDGQFSFSEVRRVEINSLEFLKVYPNPSSGVFNIVAGVELQSGNVKLYDILGREVPVRVEHSGSTTWLVQENVAPGIYILRVRKGLLQESVRIVIE